MGSACAPIEAILAHGPPLMLQLRDIDAEDIKRADAFGRQSDAALGGIEITPAVQAIVEADTELTGKMIVANPRPPQRRIAWSRARAQMAGTGGKTHQALQHVRNVRTGELEV